MRLSYYIGSGSIGNRRSRDSRIIHQNIAYYDGIADDYDRLMEKEAFNRPVREKVAVRFSEIVPRNSLVLDFGGGTGQDMPWMADQGYQILFCEPSTGMRQLAIRRREIDFPGREIGFLDGPGTNFMTWREERPFSRNVDGILANFAVFNCIPNLPALFESLSGVMKPEANLLALLLDGWSWGAHPLSIRHKEDQQTVYVHSRASIRRASSKWYRFIGAERLRGSGFILLHLTRK